MKPTKLWILLLALPLALSMISCKDDDPSPEPALMDVLENDSRFTTLVGAIESTGLAGIINAQPDATIFAPTNDAFDALGVDLGSLSQEALNRILFYHVIPTGIQSTDIQPGQTYVSTGAAGTDPAYGLSLLVENNNGTVTLNASAKVTEVDIKASNGYVHVIDEVLLPPDIVDAAIANSNFTQLTAALGAASGDLVSVLKGDGPFTVFAPVNEAFEEISSVVQGLTPDQLASVLTYHVVGDDVFASDLSNGQVVTTVNGNTFTVNINNGTVTITDTQGNDATVVCTDVTATNGVIHVITKVTLPQL